VYVVGFGFNTHLAYDGHTSITERICVIMAIDFKLTVGSHFLKVTELTARGRAAIMDFSKRFIEWDARPVKSKWAKHSEKADDGRIFRARTQDKQEYRFHRHSMKDLLDFVRHYNISEEYYTREDLQPYAAYPVTLEIHEGWEDYDYQVPAIAFVTAPGLVNRLLRLGTGKGKSYCMCRGIGQVGVRSIFIIRPSYINKWIIDIRRIFKVEMDDVFVIKKGDELKSLLARALSGEKFEFKIMLISNVLIQNWIKDYELYREQSALLGWPCAPHEMYQVLEIGFRTIDEVHLDFHRNFRIDLYTHVNHASSMSATMDADDPFRNRMQTLAYPGHERHGDGSIDKYMIGVGWKYQIRDPQEILRKTMKTGMYSQFNFEAQILKDKRLTRPYIQMIVDMIDVLYLEDDFWKPGDKCLVYVASIGMADAVLAYLKSKYYELDVRRYVESDPYDNLMDGDMVVTNLQKAGANVDIPRLSTVVLAHAVDSKESNIQGSGRLRELKDGRNPRFGWLTNIDIPKQMAYHERKMKLLKNRTISLRDMRYSKTLG
jgi:hypothetical protein